MEESVSADQGMRACKLFFLCIFAVESERCFILSFVSTGLTDGLAVVAGRR